MSGNQPRDPSSQHRGVGMIVRNGTSTRFYVQQKDADYPVYPRAYSLFGGAADPGESHAQALARELAEELGADAAIELLAAEPRLVAEHQVRRPAFGPGAEGSFGFALFEVVVDDAQLDRLARTRVFEGERGAVMTRDQLVSLPFIWGLEIVIQAYLAQLPSTPL